MIELFPERGWPAMPRCSVWRIWFGACLVAIGLTGVGVAQDDTGDDTDNGPKIMTGDRTQRRKAKVRIHEGDTWKKNPPVWSIPDARGKDEKKPIQHPYAMNATVNPGPGVYPGGPNGAWGQPYYYTATGAGGPAAGLYGNSTFGLPDYGYSLMPDEGLVTAGYDFGGGPGYDPGLGYDGGSAAGGFYGPGASGAWGAGTGGYAYGGSAGPSYNYGSGSGVWGAGTGGYAYGGYAGGGFGPGGFGGYGVGGPSYNGGLAYGYGPGGYGPGGVAAFPGGMPGNPYMYHFGPGFYRNQEAGHYRFPFFSYRRPWYFPGHPSYSRDTNIPW